MFYRLFASVSAWLFAALIVCPCTAPFSSCDISTLVLPATTRASMAIHHDGPIASVTAANEGSSGGSFLDEKRFEEMAIVAAVTASIAPARPSSIRTASVRSSGIRLPLITLRL